MHSFLCRLRVLVAYSHSSFFRTCSMLGASAMQAVFCLACRMYVLHARLNCLYRGDWCAGGTPSCVLGKGTLLHREHTVIIPDESQGPSMCTMHVAAQ
jgi:hypothetical protein